jgi:hypothetical protein
VTEKKLGDERKKNKTPNKTPKRQAAFDISDPLGLLGGLLVLGGAFP